MKIRNPRPGGTARATILIPTEEVGQTPRKPESASSYSLYLHGPTCTCRVEPQPQPHVQPHPPHRALSPSAESVLSIISHPVGQPASSTRQLLPMAQPPPQTAPRSTAAQPAAPPHPEDGEPADNDGQDGGRYCYCQGPSYGEMVGCDDEHCAYEWVRYLLARATAPLICG
jgi:hypothetical protein